MLENEAASQYKTAKKTYSRVGLALFGIGLISMGGQLLALAVLSNLQIDYSASGWAVWLITFLPIYGVGIPVGLLMMRRLPAETPWQIPLGGENFCLLLLMCFPIMYGGNIIGTLLSGLLSGGSAENAIVSYVSDESPLKILVMVVLAPLLEEFVFRKQIIDRCGKYGEKQAVLFSGLTFGLFHMNLFQFFYAFGLGLVFAYVYTRTRRLRYSVIMHMIINFMGSALAPWLLSIVDLEAISSLAEGNIDETALAEVLPGLMLYGGYVLLLLFLFVAGLVVLIAQRERFVFAPASEELPKGQRFSAVYCNVGVILFTVLCIGMCVVSLVL